MGFVSEKKSSSHFQEFFCPTNAVCHLSSSYARTDTIIPYISDILGIQKVAMETRIHFPGLGKQFSKSTDNCCMAVV